MSPSQYVAIAAGLLSTVVVEGWSPHVEGWSPHHRRHGPIARRGGGAATSSSFSWTSPSWTASSSLSAASLEGLDMGVFSPEEEGVDPGEVFCNRELAMSSIEAIGFDMDYTIAQYKREFDLLAYDGALAKLVHNMGYPPEVGSFSYRPERFTRGLVLDKRRGNILKMDRYKYVRVASHGSRQLSREERRAVYSSGGDSAMPTYTGKDYVNVDTLFHIVDAVIFEQLVDLKDGYADRAAARRRRQEDGEDDGEDEEDAFEAMLAGKSYFDIYTDVRRCVDLCHRDGVIKDEVARDPSKYVIRDPALFPMLEQFRLAGKKVFLLTNSLYDYTHVVMNYLFDGTVVSREADPNAARFRRWTDAFDVVVCGSCKPAYMQDPYLSLFRVDPQSQFLQNSDGVPVSGDAAKNRPLGPGGGVGGGGDGAARKAAAKKAAAMNGEEEEDDDDDDDDDEDGSSSSSSSSSGNARPAVSSAYEQGGPAAAFLADGKLFQGGNWLHLHDMLSVSGGDRVLYVGDHTYSDILRSKRTLGWRTCLVIPELEHETATYRKTATAGDWRRLQRLLRRRDEADRQVDAISLKLYRADMALMREAASEEAAENAADMAGGAASGSDLDGTGGGGGEGGARLKSGGVVGAGVGSKSRVVMGEFRDMSNPGSVGLLGVEEDEDDDDEQVDDDDDEEDDDDYDDAAALDDDGDAEAGEGDGTAAAAAAAEEVEEEAAGAADEDEEEDESVYDFERSAREAMAEELADQLVSQASAKEDVREACRHYHGVFHPRWGQLFKAGFMDSRFAKQVVDYACLYTTRASDLGSVSPTRDFRPFSDIMPHDLFARQNDLGDLFYEGNPDDGAGGELVLGEFDEETALRNGGDALGEDGATFS